MFKFELEEQENVSKTSTIWAEKFKPTTLNDFIGDSTFKDTIQSFIDNKEIKNLFLHGSCGTGKSVIAKLIINTLPCDSLWVNTSDENGVLTIRSKIQDFAMTVGIQPFKIIVLDECDFGTPEFFAILRGVIDQYQASTRFIMTCNFPDKVPDAIKSRCQSFEVKPLDNVAIMKHIIKILIAENIKFKNEDVAFIVQSYAPDLRKIINVAQQSSVDGELTLARANSADHDYKIKLIELLKSSSSNRDAFKEIRQLVADAAFSNYEEIYKYLFNKVDDYANGHEAEVILILADTVYQNSLIFEREISAVACMHKIISAIK
jgi:replication factor C small subunit